MTRPSSTAVAKPVGAPTWRRSARWLLLTATPILLGATLWFHPHGGEHVHAALTPVVDTWVLVHILLLPLFGLLGACLFVLLRGYAGPVATIGRIGTAVYLVCYIAFEAIVGIATGLLIRAAQPLPPERQAGASEVVQVLATDPLVATMALIGTAGAIVAVVALAILLRRAGAPLVPIVLLVGAPVTVVTHGGTTVDVLGMLSFLIAVVWLELGWKVQSDRRVREQRSLLED